MAQTIGLNISLEALETSRLQKEQEPPALKVFCSIRVQNCSCFALKHISLPHFAIFIAFFWKDASSVHAATGGNMCRSLAAEHKGEFLQVSAQFTNI